MARIERAETSEKPMGLVQGKKPGSREEWMYAVALVDNAWPFEFQVNMFGGRSAGGQVLDFFVNTVPPTIVFIDGYKWHGGKASEDKDFMQRLRIMQKLAGHVMPQYVVVNDYDIPTQEDAVSAVSQVFGRGPGANREDIQHVT